MDVREFSSLNEAFDYAKLNNRIVPWEPIKGYVSVKCQHSTYFKTKNIDKIGACYFTLTSQSKNSKCFAFSIFCDDKEKCCYEIILPKDWKTRIVPYSEIPKKENPIIALTQLPTTLEEGYAYAEKKW